MIRVCFTGGPGGGKSSAQSVVTEIMEVVRILGIEVYNSVEN